MFDLIIVILLIIDALACVIKEWYATVSIYLLFAFNHARPRDNDNPRAADFHVANGDDGILHLCFPWSNLVVIGSRRHPLNTWQQRKFFHVDDALAKLALSGTWGGEGEGGFLDIVLFVF